jgi:dTDP-4-dehydrorhamnose reductase
VNAAAASPILVLGATGLLGQALTAVGAERGAGIVGLARRGSDITCDACDDRALAAVLEQVRPAVIINAAGLTDVEVCESNRDEAWRLNARMPGVLADLARVWGCYLVHVSTDHFYCGDGPRPHGEDETVRLVNEYARSKFAGEGLVLNVSEALVVRTNIVGFRGDRARPTFVEAMIDRLVRGESVALFTDFFTSSIAVRQLAEAILDLLPGRPRGRLNVASREVSSKRDFVMAMAAGLGLDSGYCRSGSVRELAGTPRAESLGLDVSRAEATLGRRLPTLAQVIGCLAREFGELHACLGNRSATTA